MHNIALCSCVTMLLYFPVTCVQLFHFFPSTKINDYGNVVIDFGVPALGNQLMILPSMNTNTSDNLTYILDYSYVFIFVVNVTQPLFL